MVTSDNRELHITSLGECSKKYWYYLQEAELKDSFPMRKTIRAQSHMTSTRGTIVHACMFQLLKYGEITDFSKETLLGNKDKEVPDDTFETILGMSQDLIEKGTLWFNETSLLAQDTPFLLDFKTSKKYVRGSFLRQLAGYEWLLNKFKFTDSNLRMEERFTVNYQGWNLTGAIDLFKPDIAPIPYKSKYEHYIVFLGGPGYTEYKLDKANRSKGKGMFQRDLDSTIIERQKVIDTGEYTCRMGMCMFCDQRGQCIGL